MSPHALRLCTEKKGDRAAKHSHCTVQVTQSALPQCSQNNTSPPGRSISYISRAASRGLDTEHSTCMHSTATAPP